MILSLSSENDLNSLSEQAIQEGGRAGRALAQAGVARQGAPLRLLLELRELVRVWRARFLLIIELLWLFEPTPRDPFSAKRQASRRENIHLPAGSLARIRTVAVRLTALR